MNMSVWESLEALAAFVYSDVHRAVLRQRRAVVRADGRGVHRAVVDPARHRAVHADAEDRVRLLRAHGPTPRAFTLKVLFPPPGAADPAPCPGRTDWTCPA